MKKTQHFFQSPGIMVPGPDVFALWLQDTVPFCTGVSAEQGSEEGSGLDNLHLNSDFATCC